MKKIPFFKYSSCGNNFVIVDDTQDSHFLEHEWSAFAPEAASISFGIGCDNLLVVQRATMRTLDAIATERRYWDVLPDLSSADFIFRMFEPNGDEALCCGNGLICVADFLRREHGVEKTNIVTEIPLATPAILSIGSNTQNANCWVNLGVPRRMPERLVASSALLPFDSSINVIEDLEILFRRHDLKQYTDSNSLKIRGYVVFTGEPHLVIFPDHDFSIPLLADQIFGLSKSGVPPSCNRKNFGAWLVHRIGNYINKRYSHIFPEGISVNFARLNNHNTVVNRCFERGINRETLACSTGALAVSYVVQNLFSSEVSSITLLPLRCRQELRDGAIKVEQKKDGWHLSTTPLLLFEGAYQNFTTQLSYNDSEEHLFSNDQQFIHQMELETSHPESISLKSE